MGGSILVRWLLHFTYFLLLLPAPRFTHLHEERAPVTTKEERRLGIPWPVIYCPSLLLALYLP